MSRAPSPTRLGLVLAAVLSLAAATLAQAPAAERPAPASFGVVCWVPAERATQPAYLRALRDLGIDAINLGPDGDPAPLAEAGLDFYLDQPIGKGFLELRDRDFEPLQKAYETSRDASRLVRPQCLRDGDLRLQLGVRAGEAAARALQAKGSSVRFVALADEASSTRHANPLDLCRCARCLSAFRAFALARHGSLERANAEWATQFATEAAIEPLTTDQIRRRELGGVLLPENLTPWTDWLDFVDQGFAEAVHALEQQVRAERSTLRVGLTGIQAPSAFGGHDYVRLFEGATLVEAYDQGGAVELARSLAPSAQHWSTLMLPTEFAADTGDLLVARLAEAAARGQHGTVLWNDERLLSADGKPGRGGELLRAALQRMRPSLDACAGAMPEADSVWICESQSSVRAWWMLDSAKDGMTWVRRMSSYEATHSTSLSARRGWLELLQDVGIAPRFVGESDLPLRLLQERPRLLVLPASIALSDRLCSAIANYVRQGGHVVADHTPALFDERLRRRATGGLDVLFGIEQRSFRWEDLGVREGSLRQGSHGPVESGLRAAVAERIAGEPVFVEKLHQRGRAVCLNLPVFAYAGLRLDPASVVAAADLRKRMRQVLAAALVVPRCDVRGEGLPACLARSFLRDASGRRLLAVRLDAIDSPGLLRELSQNGPRAVRLLFPAPVRLFSLRGEELGSGAEIEARLDLYAGLFVEVRS